MVKQGVFAAKAVDRFNDHKRVTGMIINKDYHLPLYGKVIISGMQAVNSNSDKKW